MNTSVSNPNVSVVVPTRNRGSVLRENAQAILSQDYDDYEVVYCDDGSTDDTAEILERLASESGGRLRFVVGEGCGPGPARNAAVAEARGEFLLFTDDDTVPPDDWISSMMRCREAYGCDALSGGFKPFSMEGSVERYLHYRMAITFGDAPKLVRAAPMMNFLISRELFLKIGGFSREPLTALEDWDFCHKLRDAGLTIQYDPASSVLHHYQNDLESAKSRLRATGALGIRVAEGRYNLTAYVLLCMLRCDLAPFWIPRHYPMNLYLTAWKMEYHFTVARMRAYFRHITARPSIEQF